MTEATLDIEKIRLDFPCLNQKMNGKQLVFLDSAASAQKPQVVLDKLLSVYQHDYANVHRGLYALSERATTQFETVRQQVADYLGAHSQDEIVFTRGATEAINLVAHSYGGAHLQAGDEVIISAMEHHANIVPWQQICAQTGAILRVAMITPAGELDWDHYQSLLTQQTKIVAMTHLSNVLGTQVPIADVITAAHAVGAVVLVDACQSIVHQSIDVQALDADFLVFSGHKLYGPNGTGVLYGKRALLDTMPPYQTGGEMVDTVTFEKTTFMPPPLRFEAGTPVIAEVIALGAVLAYLDSLDQSAVQAHEQALHAKLLACFDELPNFTIIGAAKDRSGVVSFVHKSAHASDIGEILDQCGVAIRTGHHCAQPLLQHLGYSSVARASVALYNNEADIEMFARSLQKVDQFFG